MTLYGYAGEILRINLSKGRITVHNVTESSLKMYLGGTGLAVRILWDYLKPKVDPLSPENKFIIATGPFTGTLIPGSGSVEFCFKSPLTCIWGETRAGGCFGPKVKFAGYDLIVIEGSSDKPVYIYIHDDTVEIKNASHIWGKTVHEATEILLEETSRDASVACIGPAGERLVRFANVMVDYDRAAGRCGGGAVLGSKKVKAIVIDGDKDIAIARPREFYEAALEAINAVKAQQTRLGRYGTLGGLASLNKTGALPTKNFQTTFFEEAEKISGETLAEKYLIKPRACFACPIGCGRYVWVPWGKYKTPPHEGMEYETVDMLGCQTLVSDLEALIKASYLCNQYGIDTISTGNVIAFAIEAFERGLITEKDTGGLKLEWGNPDVVLSLIEMIARREGIGHLLAEGVKRVSEKIGGKAVDFACHVKGLEVPAHDPRATSKSFAIQYAIGNPRGACHIEPVWPGLWDFSRIDLGLREYGLPWPPLSRFDEEVDKRVQAYRLLILYGELAGILGICRFPMQNRYDNALNLDRIVKLLTSLTGWDIAAKELLLISERVYTLKRTFNVREGITRKDDRLPKRLMEPVKTGPSQGQRVVNLDRMLDKFYEVMGWDRDTGRPTYDKLVELGLADIAVILWR